MLAAAGVDRNDPERSNATWNRTSTLSMTKLLIKVTQAHINEGDAGNCVRCPVAIALMEINWSRSSSLEA